MRTKPSPAHRVRRWKCTCWTSCPAASPFDCQTLIPAGLNARRNALATRTTDLHQLSSQVGGQCVNNFDVRLWQHEDVRRIGPTWLAQVHDHRRVFVLVGNGSIGLSSPDLAEDAAALPLGCHAQIISLLRCSWTEEAAWAIGCLSRLGAVDRRHLVPRNEHQPMPAIVAIDQPVPEMKRCLPEVPRPLASFVTASRSELDERSGVHDRIHPAATALGHRRRSQ
jgi:hypothetical protein